MRICAVATSALCGVMLAASTARAQATTTMPDSAKVAVIRRVLEVSRTAEQMLLVMEQSLPAQRASNPAIPAVFWDRFIVHAREQRGVIIEDLVPIYDRYFSLEDLTGILRFHESPTGRRLLDATPLVTRDAMVAGQRWGAKLGEEVAAQLAKEGLLAPPP